jgi:DNA-binding response OmpR family regulator
MRLLIADDDPSLRTALRLVFEDAGHDVLEADCATDARSIIDRSMVDLVLVDAGMYDGGVQFWGELESDTAYHGRAMLLTGDVRSVGILIEHERVMGKPFDFDRLLDFIEGVGPRA